MLNKEMADTILERILYLVKNGYDVSFKPSYGGCTVIRLSKDIHRVEHFVDMEKPRLLTFCKDNEEWFLHELTVLERELEIYIRKMSTEYVTPERVRFALGDQPGLPPIYECRCGHRFNKLEFIKQPPIDGTREYCWRCKVKFKFEEETK